MIQLPLFLPAKPWQKVMEEWLSAPGNYKELPSPFTVYRTLDALDYPPTGPEEPGGPEPLSNGLGGVYIIFTEWFEGMGEGGAWQREYLYIGKALDCRQRLLGHLRRPSGGPFDKWLDRGRVWNQLADKVLWCAIAPCIVEERAAIELMMIDAFHPTFNVVKA